MVTIDNQQDIVTVNVDELRQCAETVLSLLGYKAFDLGVALVTNDMIQSYNRLYRNKDAVTDVLSFPFHQTAKPGEQIIAQTEDEQNLGDIIIAPAYVQADAARWKQTFEERMIVLLIHGICHLRGYDHESEEEYRVMHQEEQRLLYNYLSATRALDNE